MSSYPSYRCGWCTRMVCFGAGEICGECRENYKETKRVKKERESERRAGEYRHPDQRGIEITPNNSDLWDIGDEYTDKHGRTWERIG